MRTVKILYYFLLAVLVLPLSWHPSLAEAAVQAGLIKGSGPVIFYLASNGRRYAFPNEQTYRTWYRDFSGIRSVSEEDLARYPYGGNVTYRPGTRLLKRRNDSKIYTVGRGGMLRWMMNERVVRALYGQNWSRLVDELPDARVADYVFGDPVRSASDVSPSRERASTPTVGDNRRPPVVSQSSSMPPSSSGNPAASVVAPRVTPLPVIVPPSPPTPVTPVVQVTAPQSFMVEEADRGTRLTWSDVSTGERGYRVDRREATGRTFSTLTTLAANTQSYVDRTPRVGVRYVYRVVTLGSGNAAYVSNDQAITTRGTLTDRPGTSSSSASSASGSSGSGSSVSTGGRVCWPGDTSCGSSGSSGSAAGSSSSGSGSGSASTLPISTEAQVLAPYPGALRAISVANEAGLRQAFSQARPGDVIRLMGGTHTLGQQLWIDVKGEADHPIYFVAGSGRGSATIRVPSDEGINIGGGARYLVLDGLRVERTGNNVVHVQDGAENVVLRNLILSDAGEDGDVIKINQARAVTVEGCDLARPGRRPQGGDNLWQELIDVVDGDDVIIRRNWMHDFGNMAGYVKGGSRNARIEENVISNQRQGQVGEPMWGLGAWTDRELLVGEQFEAVGAVFRRNVLIGGYMGGLGIYDAQSVTIENNLFFNVNDVLIQVRAGNAPAERSEQITIQNNQFMDTRGTMPNVCEVHSHEVRSVSASANVYWNAQQSIPMEAECGFVPGTESAARREDGGWRDLRPTTYPEAMILVGRL